VGAPEDILDDFAKRGWDSLPFERMVEACATDGRTAAQFVSLAIARGGKGQTFHDAAVSFVPDELLPDLAGEAIAAFARDRNDVAEGIIARLSLERSDSLQPYLSRLFFDLRPNDSTYYAHWPWRGATVADLDRLLEYIPIAPVQEDRERAFLCVLESRQMDAIAAAIRLVAIDLTLPQSALLLEVGLEGMSRRLYRPQPFHICLPPAHVDDPSRPAWLRPFHPSWKLAGEPEKHRFGGCVATGCAVCGEPLHNLITLNPPPAELGVTSRAALSIATCLSCLGWSEPVMFFRHDPQGEPMAIGGTPAKPEFPAGPLLETEAQLARTPQRWAWQDWALSNGRENLHRIGGHPTWVQCAAYPTCPDCGSVMPALLQLDSNLPTRDGGQWLWGSGGIGYVFWCDPCAVSASLWQCT
jgi:hypothetical protein